MELSKPQDSKPYILGGNWLSPKNKYFLYFGEWNFIVPNLKKFLCFSKQNLYI